MLRYEAVNDDVLDLFGELKMKSFPELRNAKISLLFDQKKRAKGGRLELACIKRPNELIRHFTKDEAVSIEGFDYIIILDKVCWESIDDADRTRILRHELRHTYYDIESEANPYRLIDHSISDFYEEVELNRDDPKWRERIGAMTESIYEQMREDAKEQRKRAKNRPRDIHPGQMRVDEVGEKRQYKMDRGKR